MLPVKLPYHTCTPHLFFSESENRYHSTDCVLVMKTKAPVVPKNGPVVRLFFFLSDGLYVDEASGPRKSGPRKMKSANGRELLSIESFGYICEDQTTGPLRGPLGGGEGLGIGTCEAAFPAVVQ